MRWQSIQKQGGLAVITGGASGIGLAAARHLAGQGFEILLADLAPEPLAAAAQGLRDNGAVVHTQAADVSNPDQMDNLAHYAFGLGRVALLMNNAGMAIPSTTLDQPAAWRKMMDVNFFGVLNGVQSFLPKLIEAGSPAAVINTGSKQGITNPPGNPGYNASKAALKVLTEQLAHEMRDTAAPIDVHLFVPGFTYTPMIARVMPSKPDGAWTSEECVGYLFDRVGQGDFYILCPDNMVTPHIDARRLLWSVADIVENRPALSRWHPDWAAAFASFERDGPTE